MFWLDFEGVSSKVISLSLEEVGRKVFGAIAIVEAERSAEGRCWDAPFGSAGHDLSPACLRLVYRLVEEVVEE